MAAEEAEVAALWRLAEAADAAADPGALPAGLAALAAAWAPLPAPPPAAALHAARLLGGVAAYE